MLSISIVTYKTDVETVAQLLNSLKLAIAVLPSNFTIDSISIVDNSPPGLFHDSFIQNIIGLSEYLSITNSGKNLGYGKAHNSIIKKTSSKYHLILNPDVTVEKECLLNGLNFLESNQNVAAISPQVCDAAGIVQNITKSYPAIFDLFLRAINSKKLNSCYKARLEKYENRDIHLNKCTSDVMLISGCFMLCRTDALKKIGGFNENYFLYFEDYSLSIELNKLGTLKYVPSMKITHFGGNASRKGIKHIYYFIRSAFKFYNMHGWKIY